MVLRWEVKVIAAAIEAAAAAVAEMNWKHKVTPDQGDLNIYLSKRCSWSKYA